MAELPREIERKYLLRELPELPADSDSIEIEQGWLPGKLLQERLRRTTRKDEVKCLRTIKLGSGIERIEVEEECDRALFDAMWPLTEGRRIRKVRHRARDGALLWEIDQFHDQPLVLAEVELESVDQNVPIPAWLEPVLEREVTGEREYTNRALAR